MPDAGLDAEKLGVLRRWGAGLQGDPREEVAAAGRAITLLIEEIERLHVLVWDRRLYPDSPVPIEPPATAPDDAAAEPPQPTPRRPLRQRLRRATQQALPQADPQADPPSAAGVFDVLQQAGEAESEGPADASETG